MSDSSVSRTLAAAAVAAIAALSLSACASSGNDDVVDLGTANVGATAPAPAATDGDTSQQGAVIPVTGFEYGYQLVAPVDAGTYTFELANVGEMEHDLVIEGEGANEATAIIGPGETDSLTVDLAPGTYTLYCSVGNHRAQGMEITFTVA